MKNSTKREKFEEEFFFEKIILKVIGTNSYIPILVIDLIFVSIVGHCDFLLSKIRHTTTKNDNKYRAEKKYINFCKRTVSQPLKP